MSKHCDNCGTRLSDGFCPNCEESGFIADTQADFMPEIWTEEFMHKVDIDRRARRATQSTPETP